MRLLIDFWVFLATLTGWIPSHRLRLFLYRTVFRMDIGHDTSIHWQARFNLPSGVRIGHNSIIGNNAFLDGRFFRTWSAGQSKWKTYISDFIHPTARPLTIGNNVSIAGDVCIFTMEHDIDDPHFRERAGPVEIGDYAVIGTRAIILPGVHIGKGAVVASGAVVTKDVDDFALVGGVPAQFIRNRSKDLKYTLKFFRAFQ
jgi:acetyltransferase-like isoleucine patch superfamily enzyme